jgi:hypothetical protein
MNHPPVSFDLNFQHLCVFGTRKAIERQTALRALWLVQGCVLMAGGQLRLHRAPVTGGAVLLSSWAATGCRPSLILTMFVPFALAGEYALLQIADLAPRQVQFSLQCGVRLDASRLELTQNALVTKLAPLEASDSFAMQCLPIMCSRLQGYVLLPGNRHKRVC